VDNPAMPPCADWHPILPSHALGAGERLVATRALGQDLVAWRSAAGVVQVWRDRCPHRGVRLSLGRIIGGRLSCAYHGWEFAADTGRCTLVPALADLAGVPGQVGARVCAATETRQMVWVRLDADAARPGSALPIEPAGDAGPVTFLRSIGMDAGIDTVHGTLQQCGFAPQGPATWCGSLAGQAVRLFTHPAQPDLSFVHAWAVTPAPAQAPGAVFAALRRLRSAAEAAQGRRSHTP
jgi:nitrite reductase/ring-hydroxylating ferredoxin subunit